MNSDPYSDLFAGIEEVSIRWVRGDGERFGRGPVFGRVVDVLGEHKLELDGGWNCSCSATPCPHALMLDVVVEVCRQEGGH